MKLTIKRSEWLHGEGSVASSLLRESDSKKCCLGFLAFQLGASREQIWGKSAPSNTSDIPWPEGFVEILIERNVHINTENCVDLMFDNDNLVLCEAEREFRLAQKFARLGIEVEFVD